MGIVFPKLYVDFLSEIEEGEVFDVNDTGICLYSYTDLQERNQTYEVKEYEPHYFMIGQDGDLGFFIKANNPNDNAIYSCDLGGLGSTEMEKEADDIFDFVR